MRNVRILASFEPSDVGFDLFRHGHQDGGRAAVKDRFGETAALFGARAHSFDDLAVFLSHK